jgi:4-hydroxy-3-methylbut-2-en-1-yl diphosphate reductase
MTTGRPPKEDGSQKKVLLAQPRGYCAGVERAIQIVETCLDLWGPPIFVRKEIVHNRWVVESLQDRGVVFVDSEDHVPRGSICVLSAHGVSPEVQRRCRERNLRVIDATCPLVTKVHLEARRFAAEGKTIMLVGHRGHEEIEGTFGQAVDQTRVIEKPSDLDEMAIAPDDSVAYLTQTTLSVDDTRHLVDELRRRYPSIAGPRGEDICYATQNRQIATKVIAARSDVVLVVGALNSSNSNRLVEVACSAGTPAHLLPDESWLDPSWIEGARVVGVSSGASTPEVLVDQLLEALAGFGFKEIETVEAVREDVTFALPSALRRQDHTNSGRK